MGSGDVVSDNVGREEHNQQTSLVDVIKLFFGGNIDLPKIKKLKNTFFDV